MTDKQYIDIAIDISKNVKYSYDAIVVKDWKIIGKSDDKTLMKIRYNLYWQNIINVLKF